MESKCKTPSKYNNNNKIEKGEILRKSAQKFFENNKNGKFANTMSNNKKVYSPDMSGFTQKNLFKEENSKDSLAVNNDPSERKKKDSEISALDSGNFERLKLVETNEIVDRIRNENKKSSFNRDSQKSNFTEYCLDGRNNIGTNNSNRYLYNDSNGMNKNMGTNNKDLSSNYSIEFNQINKLDIGIYQENINSNANNNDKISDIPSFNKINKNNVIPDNFKESNNQFNNNIRNNNNYGQNNGNFQEWNNYLNQNFNCNNNNNLFFNNGYIGNMNYQNVPNNMRIIKQNNFTNQNCWNINNFPQNQGNNNINNNNFNNNFNQNYFNGISGFNNNNNNNMAMNNCSPQPKIINNNNLRNNYRQIFTMNNNMQFRENKFNNNCFNYANGINNERDNSFGALRRRNGNA